LALNAFQSLTPRVLATHPRQSDPLLPTSKSRFSTTSPTSALERVKERLSVSVEIVRKGARSFWKG
jgi:hypothetical protein